MTFGRIQSQMGVLVVKSVDTCQTDLVPIPIQTRNLAS